MHIPVEERFVLAVDLGTGGPKVGVVSLRGSVLAKEHQPVPTRLLPGGGAVQDAEEWWQLIVAMTRRVVLSAGVSSSQIVAVSCTGQWASTVPVDDRGSPVGDCLLWMDRRGAPYAKAIFGGPVLGYAPGLLWRWVRRTGGAPSLSGADPIGHMLFFERAMPQVAHRAAWYLEPVDYLAMRLTATAASSPASMTGAWLTDNRRLDLLTYDADLVRQSGLPAEKLPPLHPSASVVGVVAPPVARQLGLGNDVKVVAGIPDLHSASVGTGAVRDYETHMTISSTSWISCPVPFKRTDAVHQIASIPGLAGRGYLIVDNHETAGLCLNWLREQVVDPSPGARGIGFDDLSELAAGSPAGSGGVVFTPWLAGERSPVQDRNARGGFHNLSLSTRRADLVRSVLEGVAYNSRWLHEAVERFAKRRLDPIRIIGGGAQSDLWCQIHADVMGRTIERVADPLHANLRGAALLAAVALGEVDLDEVRALVAVDQAFTPDAATKATYDHLYQEFPKLYRAQKKMFGRLNRPSNATGHHRVFKLRR